MLEVLLIYLGTVIISFGVKDVNKILLIKDLAYNGLKLDNELLKSMGNKCPVCILRNTSVCYFIPIYNVITSLSSLKCYRENLQVLFNTLSNLELIKSMTQYERIKIQNNYTITHLLKVLKESEKRLQNAKHYESFNKDGRVDGEVVYEETDDGDIDILETYGKFNDRFVSEIKDEIHKKQGEYENNKIVALTCLKAELLGINVKSKCLGKRLGNGK